MRTKLATYAFAGTLDLTGIAGAALLAPAVSYAAPGDSTARSERVSQIASALSGLVTDGRPTQGQADKVASALAEARPEGHGGHGGRIAFSAVAEAPGSTPGELRTKSQAGKTVAELRGTWLAWAGSRIGRRGACCRADAADHDHQRDVGAARRGELLMRARQGGGGEI